MTSLSRSNIAQGSAPLLIMELAHPQYRGKLTTMYNTLWYVGSIIAAWTVFGMIKYTSDVSWIVPTSLQTLMPLVQMLGIWFLPESPRWLCSRGRHDEAFAVLAKVRKLQLTSESALTITSATAMAILKTIFANVSSKKFSKQYSLRRSFRKVDGWCFYKHPATASEQP